MEFMEFYSAAMEAAGLIIEPQRLVFLIGGVLIGLALGVIPGLGGIVGMALLLPFTFDMDPYTAFAFLLGMGSVTTTSDTIPAVLFGVPGTAGSAATILDGHPLAKQGQAGRAFGAAYSASMMGGVFGALLLAVSIPILRPVMLKVGAPELLAFSIFGLCMVAVLSGSAPLRGLAAAGFGLMIDMIGSDPQTGTLRWTMGTLYLWDGLPLVPVTLGIFALPELADLAISRRSISSGNEKIDSRTGQWEGVKDTFRHWWLVIRCAWLGATLGAVPGLGAAVIDWIAYGHAARTEKGAEITFGKGDIRGVLASEGANNAKEGGALVPTIAFGVPGSASMAILLGAFLIHGLVPGPDMLRQNLDVTYAIVWSVAFANIFGAGICFLASDQLAKIALIRYSVIMPLILTVIMVGAFQARRHWGDLIAVIGFGILGWLMKRLKWPRPPVILGVVLGHLVERYLNISMERYGDNWIFSSGLLFGTGRDVPLEPWQEVNWIVIVVLILAVWGLYRPFERQIKAAGGVAGMVSSFRGKAKFDLNSMFYVAFILIIGVMLWESGDWKPLARRVPFFVGWATISIAIISFLHHTFKAETRTSGEASEDGAGEPQHLDIEVDDAGVSNDLMIRRALTFLGWLVGFVSVTGLIGMLPTTLIFVIAYMRLEAREPWRLTLGCAFGLTAFSYIVFDYLLALPWPRPLIGILFPSFGEMIPSLG
jgi:TctA family transporter